MKVLQLCNKPPYPPCDGGTLAMNSITQGLLREGCQVRVLAVETDKHPADRTRMGEAYLRDTRFESVYVDTRVRPAEAAVALLCGESYNIKRFESRAFAEKLRQVLQEEAFDVVHVESLFLTPYVPMIRQNSQALVVLRAHNVEHLIWRRMAQGERSPLHRWYLKHLALALRAYELEHVNDYDGLICITQADADLLKQLGCRKPICTIPFGIETERFENLDAAPPSQETEDRALSPTLLYHLGAMDWMPNQEGVHWLLDEVWPLVHKRMPSLTLHLAGRHMPNDLLHRIQEGVVVEGEVPDAVQFIADKSICLVPLRSGSGMRVKIIEAMAAGKVVVSTSVGAEGIHYTDGHDLLIADTPQQFVQQIERCISSPVFCRTLGQNARHLATEQYSRTHLTTRLLEFYTSQMDKACTSNP